MAKIDRLNRIPVPGEADTGAQLERINSFIKIETKLLNNLAMCDASLESLASEFINNNLTGHTMIEWADRIGRLRKAKEIIIELIKLKREEYASRIKEL